MAQRHSPDQPEGHQDIRADTYLDQPRIHTRRLQQPRWSPRRHRLRPFALQQTWRHSVGLATVHHAPISHKEKSTGTSQEQQPRRMHSLRSQTGISTCLHSMQPVVLPVLFTKTPLQFQRKWRRTEPYQRLRTTVRAVGEGTHYRTNRTKAKTLCIEVLPEKARKPYNLRNRYQQSG